MTEAFSAERSESIRRSLIDEVTASAATRPRTLLTVALLAVGALIGAGASTAAFAATGGFTRPSIAQPSGEPQPDYPVAIDAPDGTIPGSPVISLIGGPRTLTLDASTEYSITDRPAGTTHARVTIVALSAGGVSWGTDAGGNNPRSSFTAADIEASADTTWYDFPLDESVTTLHFDVDQGFRALASVQYLNKTPTRLGTNARGQTYGVDGGPSGAPDLVLVTAVAPDDSLIDGYAFDTALNAFSPEHPGLPSTPEEALRWQEEREKAYPDGWDIPVFESDGVTQIGTFHIG